MPINRNRLHGVLVLSGLSLYLILKSLDLRTVAYMFKYFLFAYTFIGLNSYINNSLKSRKLKLNIILICTSTMLYSFGFITIPIELPVVTPLASLLDIILAICLIQLSRELRVKLKIPYSNIFSLLVLVLGIPSLILSIELFVDLLWGELIVLSINSYISFLLGFSRVLYKMKDLTYFILTIFLGLILIMRTDDYNI